MNTILLLAILSVTAHASQDSCETAALRAVEFRMAQEEIPGFGEVERASEGEYEILWTISGDDGDCRIPFQVKTKRDPETGACRAIQMQDLRESGADSCS